MVNANWGIVIAYQGSYYKLGWPLQIGAQHLFVFFDKLSKNRGHQP